MKIMIFSDSHLYGFDEKKYRYLAHTIAAFDKVIINGDFWDGYITTFDAFLDSPWKALFPLLKKKNAVYIYGNHDKKEFSDTRVSRFSTEAVHSFTIHVGGTSYICEHGDRIAPEIDSTIPWIQQPPFGYITEHLPLVGTSLVGWNFLRIIAPHVRKKLKNYAATHSGFRLYGHCHIPEIDMVGRYGNSGAIRWGLSAYLCIHDGALSLVKERYS